MYFIVTIVRFVNIFFPIWRCCGITNIWSDCL